VILRLEGREEAADDRAGQKRTWARARSLVEKSDEPGGFNEGLMELGATVCAPRNPRCMFCPVRECCGAFASGRQDAIPRPKRAAARTTLFITAVLAIDARGRRLIEQRAETGLWAGMHQPPSVERADRFATDDEVRAELGLRASSEIDAFAHQTTHRDVRFRVVLAAGARAGRGRRWVSPSAIGSLALGNPQRRILLETEVPRRAERAADEAAGGAAGR